jgi:hypothetical protein
VFDPVGRCGVPTTSLRQATLLLAGRDASVADQLSTARIVSKPTDKTKSETLIADMSRGLKGRPRPG